MPTDTPKYIGGIGEPEDFYCEHILEIEHGDNSFPAIEAKMVETFAEARDEFLEDNEPECPYISEIYVRSREVQKLVRAVDGYIKSLDGMIKGTSGKIVMEQAFNELAEARAALADIK
jgi:hypothetical protein